MDVSSAAQVPPPEPATPPRKRPFGVLVVALIQLAAVAIPLAIALTSSTMPWEGVLVTYLQDHSWARAVILGLSVLVVVAVVGMWRLRYWGWAIMVSLVGISLVLDIAAWWRTGPETGLAAFVRLAMDVVCAFYLNTRAVQDAFRRPTLPAYAPVANTQSAGRVDP